MNHSKTEALISRTFLSSEKSICKIPSSAFVSHNYFLKKKPNFFFTSRPHSRVMKMRYLKKTEKHETKTKIVKRFSLSQSIRGVISSAIEKKFFLLKLFPIFFVPFKVKNEVDVRDRQG